MGRVPPACRSACRPGGAFAHARRVLAVTYARARPSRWSVASTGREAQGGERATMRARATSWLEVPCILPPRKNRRCERLRMWLEPSEFDTRCADGVRDGASGASASGSPTRSAHLLLLERWGDSMSATSTGASGYVRGPLLVLLSGPSRVATSKRTEHLASTPRFGEHRGRLKERFRGHRRRFSMDARTQSAWIAAPEQGYARAPPVFRWHRNPHEQRVFRNLRASRCNPPRATRSGDSRVPTPAPRPMRPVKRVASRAMHSEGWLGKSQKRRLLRPIFDSFMTVERDGIVLNLQSLSPRVLEPRGDAWPRRALIAGPT